ncbi:MAG: hypothetical protein IJK93_00525 [Muribaculaceae bacterium]|nr:hypothetical protein [Muribaculaceae bacterium]
MLVVEHGAVGVAQFLHDGALVDVGAGELFTLTGVGTVIAQGAVDVTIAGGNDVAAIAGLGEQQVAVGTVALVGQTVGRQCLDERQGAVRGRLHEAVGCHEPRVIAVRTTAPHDHRHKH